MPLLADIPSLSWPEALLRIVVAAALGGVVGIERELREHDAGFRTHMLVSIGSALFTIVSAYAFRGAGAIIRPRGCRSAGSRPRRRCGSRRRSEWRSAPATTAER